MLRFSLMAMVILLTAFCGGCGYHYAGSAGTPSMIGHRSLHVAVLANRTHRAGLESIATQSLIAELARYSGGNLVDAASADLLLNGAVLSYVVAPVAYTAADKVAANRATMKLQVVLSEKQSGKVIWKGEVAASQDYPAATDIALQRNNEAAAVTDICRRLAEQVQLKMQEEF